jgi:hypothetical protein
MIIEALFTIVSMLFWPLLLVGLIVYFVRRKRGGQVGPELEQTLAEISALLGDVRRRLRDLEERMARLERQEGVAPAPAVAPTAPPEAATAAVLAAPPAEVRPEDAAAARAARLKEIFGGEPPAEPPAALPPTPPPSEVEAAPVAPTAVEEALSALALRRRELEQRLIENWTGILGAVVVVAGVTFVGIYTALQLSPFLRFLLTLGAGALLVGGSFVLATKGTWQVFAGWLRSAGAAIALFACAAAGGLPGLGLQWITEPLPALIVLLAGIVGNLLIAGIGATQAVATLHVVLSMMPLLLVPATTTSLAIASAVALFGVMLAARGRWDRALAIVLGATLVFHLGWLAQLGGVPGDDVARYLAAGCAALVFGAAALVHHREGFGASSSPPPLQVGIHLAGWLLLALALFVYLPSPLVRAAVLLACGVLSWRFAERARATGVVWLRRADLLAAQAFVLLALLSGHELGATTALLLLFVFAETLGFRWLVPQGEDELLDAVANSLPTIAAALLALAGLGDLSLTAADKSITTAVTLLLGSALAILGQRVLRAPPESAGRLKSAREIDAWLGTPGIALGAIAGVLVLLALAAVADRPWREAAALACVGALLVTWSRLRRQGQQTGVMAALLGAHLMAWTRLLSGLDWAPWPLTIHVAPLAALAAAAIVIAREGPVRTLAVALLGITVGLAAFLYLDPLSPLIPGVAWLMLSLVALEVANRVARRDSAAVLLLGYGYLVAFAVAYALVIVQAPAYIGAISARLLIELLALGVLGFWWLFRPREALAAGRAWTVAHPLFVELLLAGVAVTVVVEIASQWWAVAWAVVALLLLSPPGERLLDARARLYSLLFYWVSVADMAVVMSVLEVPSPDWFEQPEFTSLMAIALQVAYVVAAHRRLLLAGLETPPPLRVLERLGELVAARRNLYVYYPLFAGVALFLYWRFDRSILTLLWAAEAFVVFVLSAWLRENQFRYVALAGLGACLVRLVLIDMAEANLAVRGLVFIGVGSLMLGMNAIYNRYRARFGG